MVSNRHPLALAIILIAAVCSTWGTAQTPSQPTELEGTWDGELMTRVGEKRGYKPGELWMTFTGNRLVSVGIISLTKTEVSFALNPNTRPKQFDYPHAPSLTKQCIYELRGDTLTLIIPRGSDPRPTDMDDKVATRLVLKRRKEK